MRKLSQTAKLEIAVALHLFKDFKSQGKLDAKVMGRTIKLSKMLGVYKEFDELHCFLPPFVIKEKK